jgi:hypothetical protein
VVALGHQSAVSQERKDWQVQVTMNKKGTV